MTTIWYTHATKVQECPPKWRGMHVTGPVKLSQPINAAAGRPGAVCGHCRLAAGTGACYGRGQINHACIKQLQVAIVNLLLSFIGAPCPLYAQGSLVGRRGAVWGGQGLMCGLWKWWPVKSGNMAGGEVRKNPGRAIWRGLRRGTGKEGRRRRLGYRERGRHKRCLIAPCGHVSDLAET